MPSKPVAEAATSAGPWRPWTIVLPSVLGLFWCALLILADGATAIMASWDMPAPGSRWVAAGLAGHSFLAAASVALLALGLTVPARRRVAAVGAWLIIPAGLGLLLLMGRLVGGA